MMEQVEARGRALGEAAAERRRDGVAEVLRAGFVGADVSIAGDRVTVEGRALVRRMIDEPLLRSISAALR